MPLKFVECFGETLGSPSLPAALRARACPFVGGMCGKIFRGGPTSGSCTLAMQSDGIPVISCPKRLYADNYRILRDVAKSAFGDSVPLILEGESPPSEVEFAIAFGQKQGKEIRVPHQKAEGGSKFSVDWVIAKVSAEFELIEFVAAEVQTIDTTGNYQDQFWQIAEGLAPEIVKGLEKPKPTASSFNFENVNKRILPQLITKGHILRREKLCSKGLYFVCPSVVFDKILQRVGDLPEYPQQTGSITILGYQLDLSSDRRPVPLMLEKSLTTTTEQLSLAFSSAIGLPASGVYEEAIRRALRDRFQ